MCISKRFQNNGSTGNHGMQEVDVLKRRMLEDKFAEETTELTCHCGNGCEFTILREELTEKEAALISLKINLDKLCPFCRTKNGQIDFEFCSKHQNHMKEFTFTINGKQIPTMYKPAGYKFLPPLLEDED